MTKPYGFMDNTEISFFDEGAEPPSTNVDLLNFTDEDDSFGMLGRIIQQARRSLADAPTGFARAVLKFGDSTLARLLQNRASLVCDGESISFDDLNFNQLDQLDLLPIVLSVLADHNFVLGDEDLALPEIRITQEMFCASYVLRAAFNATYCFEGELKTYYLMQASAAFGVMQSLVPASNNSISDAVASSLRRGAAKRSASSRWSRLDDAKELAFKRRNKYAESSRSAAIDKFLPEVIEACRAAGEPLTGGDPKRTVTDWFRKAGIK